VDACGRVHFRSCWGCEWKGTRIYVLYPILGIKWACLPLRGKEYARLPTSL